MKEFEHIEQYLLGDLSPNDKASFESLLDENQKLSQEVDLQKDIMEAIQQNRRMELKNRLNNLEVPAPRYPVGKVATLSAVALTVVALIVAFFYFQEEEVVVSSNKIIPTKEIPQQKNQQEIATKDIKEDVPKKPVIVENTTTQKATIKKEEATKAKVIQKEIKDKVEIVKVEEDTKDTFDYKIHYQFRDDVLTLYNDVAHKNVIKTDIGDGQKSYLCINDHFFELVESNEILLLSETIVTDTKKIELLLKFKK